MKLREKNAPLPTFFSGSNRDVMVRPSPIRLVIVSVRSCRLRSLEGLNTGESSTIFPFGSALVLGTLPDSMASAPVVPFSRRRIEAGSVIFQISSVTASNNALGDSCCPFVVSRGLLYVWN